MEQQDSNLQPIKQGIPVMLVAQPLEDNEINIFDLFRSIARRKGLIAVIAGATTLIGLLYTLMAPRVYETESTLVPPSAQEAQAMMEFDPEASPKILFDTFSKEILSATVLRDYFEHHGASEKLYPEARTDQERRDAFKSFTESLQWKDGILSMTGPDPKLIASMLDDLVTQSEKKIRNDIVVYRRVLVQVKILDMKRQLQTLIEAYENKRLNRITQYQLALEIAKKLNISEPRLPIAKAGSTKEKGFSIISTEFPLYMLGSNALQVELDALKESKDQHQLNPEEFALQQQIMYLEEKINIKTDDFRIMRVEKEAFAPEHPIKPKRVLVLLGALFFGLTLGIVAAFITEAGNRKKNTAQA